MEAGEVVVIDVGAEYGRYAGAFLPGFMLSALYIGYIIVSAKIKPSLAPPLSEEDQRVDLPKPIEMISKTRGLHCAAL
jgi:TRAP-type mannitol/chloroaromatic compound transport system permease large subunit